MRARGRRFERRHQARAVRRQKRASTLACVAELWRDFLAEDGVPEEEAHRFLAAVGEVVPGYERLLHRWRQDRAQEMEDEGVPAAEIARLLGMPRRWAEHRIGRLDNASGI